MGRIRLDDGFYTHEKARDAGLPALGLLVASIAYSHRHELDGFVPADRLHKLGHLPGALELVSHELLAESLVSAGFFEPTPHGYVIHDYADYQLTRAERDARRLRDKERKKRVRAGPIRSDADAGFREGLSVSDLAATAQNSAALPISRTPEPRDTEPFVRLRNEVHGCDERTVPAWLSASHGLPGEWACARALESLGRARGRGRVRNEPGYVTRVFQRLREEAA